MTSTIPAPSLSICIELPCDGAQEPDWSALPAKPGVFAIEDESGGTLALTTTANLRRMVGLKFMPQETQATPSRRVNYRSVARRVLALRVGSAFEADWAYLQLARQRLAATYRALLDRWQPWFIECDPTAAFPQWIKTVHPNVLVNGPIAVGPFADKHAAGRYMDLLQDAFDLCRYHHLLVQSPHATACVYKEMGRCPAPCDGTISMDAYRTMVRDALHFACTPINEWRTDITRHMQAAAHAHQFETAEHLRLQLDRTKPATRAEFSHVDRLDRFAFLGVMTGETRSMARLFLIRGGWIEPLLDLPVNADDEHLNTAIATVHARLSPHPDDFSEAAVENIGMACHHLFRPRRVKTPGSFLRIPANLNVAALKKALRAVDRHAPPDDAEPEFAEHDVESLASDDDRR